MGVIAALQLILVAEGLGALVLRRFPTGDRVETGTYRILLGLAATAALALAMGSYSVSAASAMLDAATVACPGSPPVACPATASERTAAKKPPPRNDSTG